VLCEEGYYPLHDSLAAAIKRCGIDQFDVNTVEQVAHFLLQQTPMLEQCCAIDDVLIDPCSITPDVPSRRARGALGDELRRCLLLIATAQAIRNDDRRHPTPLATRDSACTDSPRRVVVKGTIVIAESTDGAAPALPMPLDGTVILCESFEEFLVGLDTALLWRSNPTEDGIRAAVRIKCLQRARQMGEPFDWDVTDGFTLGCEFIESLRPGNFDHDVSRIQPLLVAMAATVRGELHPHEHPLRMGAGPNEPQRTRGTDTAWRRDITYEFHLHYWRTSRHPEFGCVGPHNHFDIPSYTGGEPTNAISATNCYV
jgi:hypothetical protein